ncbi:MAG: hypothetical protein ACOC55_03480 [Candidatus Natronoplasma sp.]
MGNLQEKIDRTFKSKSVRKIAIAILLAMLIIFFIWYGSLGPDPEAGDYPSQEHLIEDYQKYVGKEVEVGGKVLGTDPLEIKAEHGDQEIVLTVIDTEEKPKKNDRVTVFGTLRENNTIEAENTVRHPFWRWIYMYAVSTVAAVWIGLRLIKQWRWNRDTWTFQQREGGENHG